MKISLITGVWKRPEVFKMFAKGVRHLTDNLDIDLNVIVAGSEGKTSKKLVEDEGFIYIEMPNEPLSTKMNATALIAKELGSDYVLCMGSDDVMSVELMQEYIKWMELGYDFIGVLDFYFYDTVSGRALYWGGYRERYRRGVTCGAARCVSSSLMDKWDWQPWKLGHDDYLDNSMEGRIQGKQKILSLKSLKMYALDIKSSTNMTPFERWGNTRFIDANILKNKFSYLFE